jgi:signal transduction histidine kinase
MPHFDRQPPFRPPWWPADETFPPAGPPGMRHWRQLRGRFFRRIAATFVLLFGLSVGGCTLLFWLGAGLAGWIDLPPGAGPALARAAGIAALAAGAVFAFAAARALRRVALPLGDLMEAAGRVAEGDYAARVAERGPRELRALAGSFNAMAERLQQADEQRREFLADVTHELRTPLTVIQGKLEGMLDGVYPLDAAHLGPIVDETRVVSRLIDDLRTLSLAESGGLKLQRAPTDLAVLLHETAAAFRAQAGAAGVALEVAAESDLPLVEVDPARLREVVVNLLANALRYTPAGGRVRLQARAEPAGRVTVSVSDTGRGIAPEDLPRVFDRFYKSGDSPGSGLGLAIARNLVAAHGGEMRAESEGVPGRGATLSFTLPREAWGPDPLNSGGK